MVGFPGCTARAGPARVTVRRKAMPGMGLREAHGLLGSFQNIFKKILLISHPRVLTDTWGTQKKKSCEKSVRSVRRQSVFELMLGLHWQWLCPYPAQSRPGCTWAISAAPHYWPQLGHAIGSMPSAMAPTLHPRPRSY